MWAFVRTRPSPTTTPLPRVWRPMPTTDGPTPVASWAMVVARSSRTDMAGTPVVRDLWIASYNGPPACARPGSAYHPDMAATDPIPSA